MATNFWEKDAVAGAEKQWWANDQPVGKKAEKEESGVLRQAADIPLSVGRGALSGVRMIADAFGAGSGVSEAIKGAEGYLADLMSAQAKNDQQEISRIMKDAEDKGMLEQVKAGVKAFTVAPADLLAQGFGSAAPAIAGMLGGSVLGVGATGARILGAGIGATMGAGTTKGSIYEETKKTLVDAGLDEKQAEERAQAAQSYGGKNLDQILLGTGLGAFASATGVENAVKNILTRSAAKEAAKTAAKEIPEEAIKKGAIQVAKARAGEAAAEGIPEFIQAGQEQAAQNIALQREGYDVPTMRGVVGAGVLEGLSGAGLGAGFGSVESVMRGQAQAEAKRILDEEERVRAEQENQRIAAEQQAADAELKAKQAIQEETYARVPGQEPLGGSITRTGAATLLGAPEDQLAGVLRTRREEQEAAAQVPLSEDYAFLQREKQRLMASEKTPEVVSELGRVDQKIQSILERDLSDAQRAKESAFGERELPPVESREMIMAEEEIARLQAKERSGEELTKGEIRSIEKLRNIITKTPMAATETEKKLQSLEKQLNQIKSPSLYGNLIGKLNPSEVRDISPDIGNNLRKKGGGGTFISELVSDGQLDDYLPPGMRPDSIEFDVQESTEYIKDKLRNKDTLSFDADMQKRQLQGQIDELRKEVLEPVRADYEISDAVEAEREAKTEAMIGQATPEIESLRQRAADEGVDISAIEEQAFEESRANPDINPDTILAERLSDALGIERRYQQDSLAEASTDSGINIEPEDQRVEKELLGKSMIEVADWTINNAPNAFARVIAEKVKARLLAFQRKGMTLEFNVQAGQNRTLMMRNARGITQFDWGKDDKGTKISVTLNGAAVLDNQAGYPPGTRYATVLHELLHVATRAQFKFMPNSDPLKKQLIELFNAIADRFNEDAKAGNLPPVMQRYYKRLNNVLGDPDEMLAWGLTDKEVQTYFDDIKVGEKSVWSQLVELIRTALGLGKPYESALERLLRASDSLLEVDVNTIDAMMSKEGKQIGEKKKPAGPMVQETLFQKEVSEEPEERVKEPKRNILGMPVIGSWTMPTDTKLAGTQFNKDDLIYSLQDKQVDIKRVVQNITNTAGRIAAKWNPYLQEELYHGRTARATKEFLQDELRPLIQEIQKNGMTIEEAEKYLHNRHAEAYNNHVAKVNPNNPRMQDGGSGIKTEDARKYLEGIPADKRKVFEAIAKKVDAITKGTRKLVVDSGLESPETIAAWEKVFPDYVPLMREESDDFDYTTPAFGVGSGYDVRGKFSRAAMGSERKVANILANIAMQREKAIIKSNKNRVAQAVFGLAVQNPNPDFWLAVNPMAEKIPEIALDELRAMGIDEQAINFLMQEPTQRAIDPKKNEVVNRINATLRKSDNVLAMRVNGEDRYVFFNQNDPRAKRAAEALKNLDADQLGPILGIVSQATRWMASVNTQYNPIFGAYNFLRDVQGAALQLSNTPLAGMQKQVMSGVLPSLKAIYSSIRKERKGEKADTELAKLWNEFQEEGGQTGFRDMFSRSQERAEALEKEFKQITEGKAKAAGRAMLDWLSDYNDSMENATRLSAYKVAKEKFLKQGMSEEDAKQQAASIAKNLTVNFNRKGQIATQAGALYAFFNAAVQGTTRLAQTLSGPAGRKIIAGGLLLGTIQAAMLAAAGFDEEEPPEFVRERNIIIPIGEDKYLAFPMPLGYHVIPGFSRIITEWALSGFKNTPERIASLTGMFMEAFNPIGNAGWSVQTLAPTFADPFVALSENKDWTGKPIARKDFSNLDPTPGYTRAKDTATMFSTQLAKFLNYASGGTEFRPGVLSPTPDQIDYLIGQAFGGLGREATKLEQTIVKTSTGEELPPYKIPLVGRFYGETKSSAAESSRFYKNMTLLNEHENEIKGRRESRQPVAEYLQENPEARLAPLARKTYTNIQKLRKRREQLVEKDAPRESVKQVEEQIQRAMRTFNERVEKLKD